MFARAMHSPDHPIVAQIVPIRRCNLPAHTVTNSMPPRSRAPSGDAASHQLARALGTTIITVSGGEPMLHPELDGIIRHIRRRGVIATLITNGYLLTRERIRRFNKAGLDYLQISIDNVAPDETSKKSLKVLDGNLSCCRARHIRRERQFVLGGPVRNPTDALTIAERARALGLTSTVGILHDGGGHLRPLAPDHACIYERILAFEQSLFSFAQYDRFQRNTARGLPNDWHCRAGGRFLYICENGLVHYCSQQRGHPGIPLEHYTRHHLKQEGARMKPCTPYCTISCVHQAAMLDAFREDPRGTLAGMIERRRQQTRPTGRRASQSVDLGLSRWRGRRILSRLALHFSARGPEP
jgi:hypothetical protein